MFTYLSHREILQNALVCKKWQMISQDPRLWAFVSLRPEISGLHVDRVETLVRLIGTKFKELRYLEITTELITPQVRVYSCSLYNTLLPQHESQKCCDVHMAELHTQRPAVGHAS